MQRTPSPGRLRRLALPALLCLSTLVVAGEREDQAELRELLDDFMGGASAGCPTMHDRFWHPDLVYTSSDGTRFGKATLMQGVEQALEEAPGPEPSYRAEDVDIRLLGETAVVTFRLLAETPATASEPASEQQYLNSGVFVREDGQWQAITWQATRRAADSP